VIYSIIGFFELPRASARGEVWERKWASARIEHFNKSRKL